MQSHTYISCYTILSVASQGIQNRNKIVLKSYEEQEVKKNMQRKVTCYVIQEDTLFRYKIRPFLYISRLKRIPCPLVLSNK